MLTIICRVGGDEVFDESSLMFPAVVGLTYSGTSRYSFFTSTHCTTIYLYSGGRGYVGSC